MSATSLETRRRLRPWTKAALAAEVVVAYVRTRRSLRQQDLRDVLAQLRRIEPSAAHPDDELLAGRRLGRIVRRTLTPIPGDTRCLTQSLVLTQLLARRGIETSVVIGVRPGEKFAAHAWVELDGAPLLPPGDQSYAELVAL
jgi:hypothetical protein